MRRATDTGYFIQLSCGISIHALLAESDQFSYLAVILSCQFQSTLSLRRATSFSRTGLIEQLISIHALLAESDGISFHTRAGTREFQSTLSLRRATTASWEPSTGSKNFNPRSPCGERLHVLVVDGGLGLISIHALLAESDLQLGLRLFRSVISIHALLAESDMAAI